MQHACDRAPLMLAILQNPHTGVSRCVPALGRGRGNARCAGVSYATLLILASKARRGLKASSAFSTSYKVMKVIIAPFVQQKVTRTCWHLLLKIIIVCDRNVFRG